jgi:hypothetical protein
MWGHEVEDASNGTPEPVEDPRGFASQGRFQFSEQVLDRAEVGAVGRLAGVVLNSEGHKFTLYSLRHFYAVMALTKGIDIYTLARNRAPR